MGTGSRPLETPQTSRSRSHPDICPTKGAGGRVSQPGRGRGGRSPDKRARAEVRVLQRVGLLLRGHRLPLASRVWRGTGTRCSWRPGHLTGPLGESSRTACFLERSAGCPPGGQLNRLSGVVSGQRLNASAATAAGRREGRAESAGNHREMRDQEPKQFMEAGKRNASGAGP